MVSTHLKNISQIGSFPQVGAKIKNICNHHLVKCSHRKKKALQFIESAWYFDPSWVIVINAWKLNQFYCWTPLVVPTQQLHEFRARNWTHDPKSSISSVSWGPTLNQSGAQRLVEDLDIVFVLLLLVSCEDQTNNPRTLTHLSKVGDNWRLPTLTYMAQGQSDHWRRNSPREFLRVSQLLMSLEGDSFEDSQTGFFS